MKRVESWEDEVALLCIHFAQNFLYNKIVMVLHEVR
jgi:hypothetical protein